MPKLLFLCILLLLINFQIFSQNISRDKSRFSISAGYGLAGSFFVNEYVEALPFPASGYRNFAKKNFLGSSQQINVGFKLNKHYELNVGLHFQHFTRRVKVTDTLSNVVISLDNTIHERNHIYLGNINRVFERKKSLYYAGMGLYYIRPISESIEYGSGTPNFYSNYEARYDNSKQEEGGAFVEFAYEYKFQPKVNIGLKTQFFYTISIASAEAITFFPYIKILF